MKYITTNNKNLPFSKLWFNDTAVFANNLGLQKIADDDSSSWIVNRLSDYKLYYPQLDAAKDIMNVEFKQKPAGKTVIPDYGMVSVDQANGMTIASAKVLGPTKDSIDKFWGEQKKGFTRNDCYAKLRVPDLDAHPRNVDKWLNVRGALDLPVYAMSRCPCLDR